MTLDDKKSIEESIKQQFHAFEGIIDLLRSGFFDKSKYRKFYETLTQYYEVIQDDISIDREIAGYLQTFHLYLYSKANCSDSLSSTIQKDVDEAWSETLELMLKFYPTA